MIAGAVRAELSLDGRTRIHREPTADVQAYQLYLQGRHCYIRYTDESIRKGIAYFQQAIAADPDYALAHAGVALAYGELAAGRGVPPRHGGAFPGPGGRAGNDVLGGRVSNCHSTPTPPRESSGCWCPRRRWRS